MVTKERELNLKKTLEVVWYNKRLIVLATGLFFIVTLIYCFLATPIYSARALINPPRLSDAGTTFSQAISGLNGLFGGGSTGIIRTDADIAMALMKSETARNLVIKKFDLKHKYQQSNLALARLALGGQVRFVNDLKSGFVEIDVENKDPKLAADIANYYTIVLGQLINDLAYGKANQRFKFYSEQLSVALENLHASESAMKVFVKNNGIIAGQQVGVIVGISTGLQGQLVAAQAQLQSMSYYVSTENSEYKALESTIASLSAQLDQLNSQNSRVDFPIPANLAPELAKQYESIMRDLKFKEVVYEVMRRQAKGAQLDSQSEITPMVVDVVDYAEVPTFRSSPQRFKLLVKYTMIGFLLSTLIALVLNYKKIICYKVID